MIRPIGKLNLLLCLCILIGITMPNAAQATLLVKVNRTQLSETDQLRLTVQIVDGSVSTQPNFSALRRDFEILRMSGPNRNESFSMINGRTESSSSTSWALDLRPRRLGTLTIPAFIYAGEQSKPITINVAPQSAAAKQKMNQSVLLETNVDSQETYVQGQIIYTVKLFYADNITGNFPTPPVLANAIVETLDDETRYDTIKNGRRYYVLEKNYTIYPQKSGTLSIPRQTFSGAKNGRGFFSDREPVMAISDAQKISVKPKPASFPDADWLPAKSFQITETWNQKNLHFKVGEPINRTLSIVAEGIAVSLIPSITSIEIDGAKTYTDPPIESQQLSSKGIFASKATTIGIVPTRAGPMTIPAISIPWWNTETDSLEIAHIPEAHFEVEALKQEKADTDATMPLPTQQIDARSLAETQLQEIKSKPVTPTSSLFWLSIAAVMTILWILTLILYLHQRNKSTQKEVQTETEIEDENESALLKHLLSACRNNDAALTQKLLFLWAKKRYPHINSIHEFAILVDTVLDDKRALAHKAQFSHQQDDDAGNIQKEISQLELSLYSANNSENSSENSSERSSATSKPAWMGQSLADLLSALVSAKQKGKQKTALMPTLNP